MSFPRNYDKTDAQDILRYAKWLIGKTFHDVLKEDACLQIQQKLTSGYNSPESKANLLHKHEAEYGNTRRKGGLGNLIEKHFFHYETNSKPEPDFPLAKLELKVTPYEVRYGRGSRAGERYFVAGERLVLTNINYNERPIKFDLYNSHLWQKCWRILLIFYLRNKCIGNNLEYRIDYVDNFTPSETDRIIIQQDYITIMNKIASGRAHEISESDTMYLGACTKGSRAAENFTTQIVSGIPAQKRAFCYKTSYMTTILNNHLIKNPESQDNVVTNCSLLKELGFEGYIQSKIKQYIGKTDREICGMLGLEYTCNKSQWSNIAFAILGIKSNRATEFQKAGIVVKAVRIEEKGNIRENISFPPFKFSELASETWVDYDEYDHEDDSLKETNNNKSTLQAYFTTTKFLFVVFKKQNDSYILKGCQLWNMPYSDLNKTVKEGWASIRHKIIEGVHFTKRMVKSGKRAGKYDILNDLPEKEANPIIHIRPHAKKAYYKFDGYETGSPSDGNELPNGDWMTTQCFWLNNTYVLNILRNDLK